MRYIFIIFFAFSAFASEVPSKLLCVASDASLEIIVLEDKVNWTFMADSNVISGHGLFQKEMDTEDAFSSFDEVYALSYKSQKAVFVLENGSTVFFSGCKTK